MPSGQALVSADRDRRLSKARSLGTYLKRLRSAFRLRRARTPKQSASDDPGAVPIASQQLSITEPFHAALPPPRLPAQHPYTFLSDTLPDAPLQPTLETPPAPHSLTSHASAAQSPESLSDSFGASLLRTSSNPLPTTDHRVKRAADLFERYGMDLDPDTLPYEPRPATAGPVERVEKPIRIRLHYHCHHCSLAIGPTSICVNCGHKLCKKCYRFPDKRDTKSLEPKTKKRKAPSPTRSETLENWLVSTPSASLAHRPAAKESTTASIFAIRRVRRLCHQCTAPFIWTERLCQDCDHEMCSRCPQDPPTMTTNLCGAAPTQVIQQRDRIFKKPRLRVRYTCEQCGSLMQEKTDFCSRCGHLRCHNCQRNPAHPLQACTMVKNQS